MIEGGRRKRRDKENSLAKTQRRQGRKRMKNSEEK
jgi:hypothetical protein